MDFSEDDLERNNHGGTEREQERDGVLAPFEEPEAAAEDFAITNADLELLDRVADLYKYGAQASFSNNDFSWLLQWGLGTTRSVAAAVDPEWKARGKDSRAPALHGQVRGRLCPCILRRLCKK
jgi:hypothetical protein